MTVTPLRRPPVPDDLSDLKARIEALKAERVALLIEKLGDVMDLAYEISDPEAGYAPGLRESARRILTDISGERLNLISISQRVK